MASLSERLKEMGFKEGSFMVFNDEKLGKLSDIPYHGYTENCDAGRVYLENCDKGLLNEAVDGRIPVGAIGKNNGLYSAKMYNQPEIIVTNDPKIAEALRSELGFKNTGLAVPLSNGEAYKNPTIQSEFESMQQRYKTNLESKRTAAVQRGDVITTYDPQDMDNGTYRNVQHYTKRQDGSLMAISAYQACEILRTEANEKQEIDRGQKLDDMAMKQIMAQSRGY